MKKIRKILQSACSILMAIVLVFSVGCSKDPGPQAVIKPAPEAPAPTFELNQSQVECIVGDVKQLAPKSLPDIGEASLTWRSENSNIVTVDNAGNLEAISEGTAKIIATYGTVSAECTVKVSWDDEIPQIVSPASADGKFAIVVGQEYTFAPAVTYRGKTYNDGQLEIYVSDDTVTAPNQETLAITGEKTGASSVTISGKWRGKDAVQATFNVTVNDNIRIFAVDEADNNYESDQIVVYTTAKSFTNNSDQLTARTFVPVAEVKTDINDEPTVKNMNDNPEDFSVTIADNLASFDQTSKTINSNKFGDTIATISFNYNEQTYVKQFIVHVERPLVEYNREIKFFSSYKGTLRDETKSYKDMNLKEFIYGDQEEIIKTAYVDDQELQIEESTGAIFGLTGTSESAYEVVLRVGTDVEQFNVKTTVFGQYVYDSTDLDIFVRTVASPELDAYVELGRDIDLTNYVKPEHFNDLDDNNKDMLPDHKWATNIRVAKGFVGTLNGNGHYLMNYTQKGKYGFFGALNRATVKNIAFVNCAQESTSFLAEYANYVTMENVYISLTSMKEYSGYFGASVIAVQDSPGGTYTNVYIDLEQANVEASYPEHKYGRYVAINYSAFLKFPDVNAVQPVLRNCLVISKAPISSSTRNTDAPVRVVLAENTTEEERTQFRQKVWKGHNVTYFDSAGKEVTGDKEKMIGSYQSKFKNDKLNIYPNYATFAEDESLYIENINNAYLDKYDNDITRTSAVCRTLGVTSYDTVAEMKNDPSSKKLLETFSSEYWTVMEGKLVWGKHPADLEAGDVFLDVGELASKQVEGISLNPLNGYEAGDTVEVGSLSCFGYIFKGWKNNDTGEMLAYDEGKGKYTFTYSGKATILIAQWEIDPDVQVNTGSK